MRTTLTLDEDVAAGLARLQKERDVSFKEVVNDALRHGLGAMKTPKKDRVPFETGSAHLGRSRLSNVDNIADVLAVSEGETFK